ncbi:MAG: FAD-dependent oxidoreductase [Minisyncoccia bacterium]|jgi:alkyl hydroperoxide reductase subunit F
MNIYDLTIVGGGPAGVAAGIYAARKKLKTVLVTDTFGGQSLVSDDIGNWIGEEHISGFDLAGKLEKHLKAHEGIEVIEGDLVSKITPSGQLFSIETKNGKSFNTKTVLVTAGSRRKKLEVPGEKEFEGKGVAYCSTCDAPVFGGKEVAVVGGGNAGLEAVTDLLPYASKIYLIHRNVALKGDPVTQEKIKSDPKVKIIFNAETQMILGEKTVTGLKYRDKITGEIKELAVQGVFVEIGIIPNGDLVRDLVSLNFRGEIVTDPKTQATSRVGIWAAGDATDGLYRQNNISAGDAIKALLNIYDYLKK